MWKLFQISVIFIVMATNIHWNWTPNPYIPAFLGVGIAYGLTLLISGAKGWLGQDHGAQQLD